MVRRIKAKLVLRLRAEGLTARQIEAQGMSRHSVIAVFDAADRACAAVRVMRADGSGYQAEYSQEACA